MDIRQKLPSLPKKVSFLLSKAVELVGTMKYYVNKFCAGFDVILLFPIVIYGKFASTRGYFL